MSITDFRIETLLSLIEEKNIQLLSLDIFDTTVWRLVPKPTDLFLVLGKRLREKGILWDTVRDSSFAFARIKAEKDAREHAQNIKGTMEVSLEEIYNSFPKGMVRSFDLKQMIEEEVDLEIEFTQIDWNIKALIDMVKVKGIKIAFVSDTYLSTMALEKILRVGQVIPEPDYLLSSVAYKTPKPLELFDVLLKKTDIMPDRILHIGDNFSADVEPAYNREINTFHWGVFYQGFQDIQEQESSNFLFKKEEQLHPFYGDYGLTSLRNRIVYNDHLTIDNEDHIPYQRYGAAILGPVLSGFMQWVVQRCQQENVDNLFCLMREGQLFKELFDVSSEAQTVKTKSHKLYVSRYALSRAVIMTASPKEIEQFILRPTPLTIKQAFCELGLEEEEYKSYQGDLEKPIASQEQFNNFMSVLHKDSKIKNNIIKKSQEQRGYLIDHIEKHVDLDKMDKLFVLDLGYSGTIQKHLQSILDFEGFSIKVHGFYLVTNDKILNLQQQGSFAEGYLADSGQPVSIAHTVGRSPEVLEQSCMADCGSLLAYEEFGMPKLDDMHIPDHQVEQIKQVQEGIKAFNKIWLLFQKNKADFFDMKESKIRSWLANILVRSITLPTEPEISTVGNWVHDENFGASKTRTLVDVDKVSHDLDFMNPHQIASIPSSKLYWPFGAAAKKNKYLGKSLHHIYMREVDPSLFQAHEEDETLIMYFDSGKGFNDDETIIHSYRKSSNGGIRARITAEYQSLNLKAIAIRPFGKNKMLRFDKIAIQLDPTIGKNNEFIYLNEQGAKSFDYVGFEAIKDRLLLSTHDMPFIVWTPEKNIDDFTGKLTVDLHLGALEVESLIA